MAEEKKEHDNKMKKMEAEMEQVFEMKVQEKQSKLKESEADVRVVFYVALLYCGVSDRCWGFMLKKRTSAKPCVNI